MKKQQFAMAKPAGLAVIRWLEKRKQASASGRKAVAKKRGRAR